MKHFEKTLLIPASPEEIFSYADNHSNFSAHMNQSSWMTGGGSMVTSTDEGHGQQIGSHIQMAGKAFGISLFLDEKVIDRRPPSVKIWETVGNLKLLVIGHYRMGFEIKSQGNDSLLRVFIGYDLPDKHKWLSRLFGGFYAKWCVEQMTNGVYQHFNTNSR